MTLTPDAERKLHVLTLLEGKRIALGQAAAALGLTPRQIRRATSRSWSAASATRWATAR